MPFTNQFTKMDFDSLRINAIAKNQQQTVVDALNNAPPPTRRFDISEFRSEIKLNGVIQTNRFVLIMAMPKGVPGLEKYAQQPKSTDPIYQNERTLTTNDSFVTLRCESAIVPGVHFFTNDNVRRYGFGQIEKRPYLPTFSPLKLNFIVDRSARVIEFFNKWANSIVYHDTNFGVSPFAQASQRPYLLKYSDDYMSKIIRLWVYDQSNQTSFGVKLHDCYPLTISDIDVDWGAENQLMRLSVLMQYSHMSTQFVYHDGSKSDSPKSATEVYNDSLNENKTPSLFEGILDHTGKLVQGEIYSGAERYINKAFDRIFK